MTAGVAGSVLSLFASGRTPSPRLVSSSPSTLAPPPLPLHLVVGPAIRSQPPSTFVTLLLLVSQHSPAVGEAAPLLALPVHRRSCSSSDRYTLWSTVGLQSLHRPARRVFFCSSSSPPRRPSGSAALVRVAACAVVSRVSCPTTIPQACLIPSHCIATPPMYLPLAGDRDASASCVFLQSLSPHSALY